MKTIGDKIFAKDADGHLVSRVGTIFLKTPGLVTKGAMHAIQRMIWLKDINERREASGVRPMNYAEEEAELAESVDLVFTDDFVLIRPDPDHMDVALRADEELQKLVSKRKIRFLNTHSAKVRNALRARGENWRMARSPVSQEDMVHQIENSRVAIDGYERIYYYNHATGTRYLTAGGCAGFEQLPPDLLRAQVKAAQTMLGRRNRVGMPEVDLFPVTTPIEIKQAIKAIDVDALTDGELREALKRNYIEWRMTMPAGLRDESVGNFEWRNEMSRTLSSGPNETATDENELIQGISPEFYRQIEWLPGAHVEHGQLMFDSVWDEYIRTKDPELAPLCDQRVRLMIFNFMRLFGDVEYYNVGRIVRSLAREPIGKAHHAAQYIVQIKMKDRTEATLYMFRFNKWGIAEHLDEGKDLLRSMFEASEYNDYVLDRRLMCQQLGMNLPLRVGMSEMTEIYNGSNMQYRGVRIKTNYVVRGYVQGIASDKIPCPKYRNPAFALKFARLMGEAAALDLIVGRLSSDTGESLFDKFYEVVQFGDDGLPEQVIVTDQTGSFVNYLRSFEESVAPYANVAIRRKDCVSDYNGFVNEYVRAFERRLKETQSDYRKRRRAYDELFMHRPYDVAGSGAYRWAKTLERLDRCDPALVAAQLEKAIRG